MRNSFWMVCLTLTAVMLSGTGNSQSEAQPASSKKQTDENQRSASPKSPVSPKSIKKDNSEKKEVAQPKDLEIDPNEVGDTKLIEQSRTNIDFSESLIDGKMNAPSGFLIQGRLSQDLTRMVRLRTSFKPEMLKSTGIPDKQK